MIAAASRHESWADEAQSWLLARDASLVHLWINLLHYEGTPGLWQTLLHLIIRSGLPFHELQAVSVVLGIAGAVIWMFRAPFPIWFRISVPFTFFLAYQYAVVARSYSLLPPLLFACAATYSEADEHPWRFGIILSALALVSVHGSVLSIAIWIGFLANKMRSGGRSWKRFAMPGLTYLLILALGVTVAWPAHDAAFITRWNLSVMHFQEVTLRTLQEAFTGNAVISGVVLLLSVPFLWKGRAILMFGLATAFLCAVGGLIYSQVWHQGVVQLGWLFAMWIAASRTEITRAASAAMSLVIVFGVYWTVSSVIYDWNHAYSGSAEAASFLKHERIPEQGIYAVGYACTAIEPYFAANIFGNVNGGGRTAYWDWSTSNHTNEDSGQLARMRPKFVVIGYKNEFEHRLWSNAVVRSGYQQFRHFEGNVFWRSRVLEPESYDLYRLSSANPIPLPSR